MFYGWHYFFRLPLIAIHPLEAVSPPVAAFMVLPSDRDLQDADNPLTAVAANAESWAQDVAALQAFVKKTGLASRKQPTLWVLFQQTGPATFMPGFIMDTRGQNNKVADFLQQSGGRWNESRYQGVQIYHTQLEGEKAISVAQFRNLLLISSLPIVVESSISQLTRPASNLFKNGAFCRLGLPDFSEKSMGSVFVNPSNLEGMNETLAPFLWPEMLADWQWMRLDALRGENGSRITGALAPSTDNDLAIALSGQKNQRDEGDWHALVPDIATLLFQTRLTKPASFFKAFDFSGNAKLKRFFQPWVGKEAIFVTLESTSTDTPPEQLWIIRSTSEKQALSKLSAWGNEEGLIKTYDYQAFTINQLMSEALPAGWNKTRRFHNPCYTTAGNYVIMASSPATMERWVDHYTVSKTMAQSPGFQQLWGNSNRPSNGFWYANLNTLGLSRGTDDALSNATRQIGALGLSVMAHGGTLDISGYSLRDTGQIEKGALIWKSQLPFAAQTAPVVLETGGPDGLAIAVQDVRHQLHLLNRQGEILWTSKLEGPVLGRMQSVDWYGDRRRQILLNTPKQIYLLNLADGKVETKFPLTLKSPAINGVLMVDFEKNGAYSIFVACENGNLYGFDRNGSPLEGWSPLAGAGKVRFSLEHFQYDHKDYLVALNEAGQLLVFKKDGSFRFPPLETLGAFRSPPAWQNTPGQMRIAATDLNGVCHVVNAEGTNFRLRLPVGRNEQVMFAFGDFTGDQRYDYAATSDSMAALYYYKDKDLQRAFSTALHMAPDSLFPVKIPGMEKSALGMVTRKSRELLLVLPDGRIHPDFPLSGVSSFQVADLFDNRRRMVVVADENSVCVYRIR